MPARSYELYFVNVLKPDSVYPKENNSALASIARSLRCGNHLSYVRTAAGMRPSLLVHLKLYLPSSKYNTPKAHLAQIFLLLN